MSDPDLHNLPRLDRHFYLAFTVVHWTMKIEPQTAGWLDDDFHRDFQELLLHGCCRENLICPAYCLMPDHLHLMWMGLALTSDQLNAIKFLRLHLNRLLAGQGLTRHSTVTNLAAKSAPGFRWKLQPLAHDHVLREEERKRGAFGSVCFYILANPVRAELVTREQDWPWSGAVVPGYPDLHPMQEDFWELFWKIYYKLKEPAPI